MFTIHQARQMVNDPQTKTFRLYEQDICMADIAASNIVEAEQKARRLFGYRDNAPIYLEEVK